MKKELQSNVNGMTSGGGSIQHPFSIHSASIGTRWKLHGLQSLMMTILLLFTMGIGQMWGADQTFTVESPAVSKRYVQDNVLIGGSVGSKKLANVSSQACFYIASGSYAPIYVQSKAANIKSITIQGNRDATSGNVDTKAFNVFTSSDLSTFTTPTDGFSASRTNNGSTTSVTSLTDIPMVANNQSYLTSVTVTFDDPVMGIRLTYSNSTSIKSVSVTYDDAITPASELCELHMTATDAAALTGTGTWTATNLQSGLTFTDTEATPNNYYYDKSSGTYGNIDLGTSKSFQEGDEMWFELGCSSLKAPTTDDVTFLLNNTNSTTGAITVQPTCTIGANMPIYARYIVQKDDALDGQQVMYIIRKSSNNRLYQITIHRTPAAVGDYTVTAVTSTGDNSRGTVSAAASSLDEDGTTSITASPAAGYQVTNWAVADGEHGASISPSGASNATSTTLTMGTANATVTVTFGLIDYTVSKTLTNCAVKDGSTAIPATMNYGDDLSTIIEPTAGNILPSSISVTGVTSYTWNASTGALTLTDVTGNVSISIEAAAPQTGSGTITYALVTSGETAATYSAGTFTGILSSGTPSLNTLGASNTLTGGNGVGVQSDKNTPKSSRTAGITSSTADFNAASSPYAEFTFSVLDGYTFTPTAISVPVLAISNNAYFTAIVTDGSSTWTSTTAECTQGAQAYINAAPLGGSALTGTVNIRVFCHNQATDAKGFRFGTGSVTITGTVIAAGACTPPTIAWDGDQPADAFVSDGSKTFTVTSNHAAGIDLELSPNTCGATVAAKAGSGNKQWVVSFTGAGSVTITPKVVGDGSTVCAETVSATAKTLTVAVGHDVTFNMNGHGTAISKQTVALGGKATEPNEPSAMGYNFGGWFKEAGCENAWDFATDVVNDDTELFAKWTAFVGCTELWPATSGDAPIAADQEIVLQSGSTGGHIYTVSAKSGKFNESFEYTMHGLALKKGGDDVISVVLGNDMAANTKISVTLVAANTGARGLNLLNGTGGSVKGGTTLGWADATVGAVKTFSYTVEAGDGLEGTNIFRLQRSNSVYLKCVKVESCGASVTYHDLTSAVNIAGKGTVTLGASSVREGYTTTAEYSAIDPLYEFVSWSISGEGATLSSTTANPVTVTMGTADAVVTLNLQVKPVYYTVTYKDGSTTLGTEQVAENGHPTATGIATKKLGYNFLGWSETDGGAVVDLNDITITDVKNLYAKYTAVVCPTSGTIFLLNMNKTVSTAVDVRNSSVDLDEYATISGGSATLANTSNNTRAQVTTTPSIRLSNGGEGYIQVELDCPVLEGDIIRYVNISSGTIGVRAAHGNATNETVLQGNKTEITTVEVNAALDGLHTIYLDRRGNTSDLTYFEIYRRPVATGVSLTNMTIRQGVSTTPVMTLAPTDDAIVNSQAWEIVGTPTNLTGAEIDAGTGAITTGTLDDESQNGSMTVKVTVNGTLSATCTITVIKSYVRANVSGSMLWDWTASCWDGQPNVELKGDDKDADVLMANTGTTMVCNDDFRSDMLVINGNYAWRLESTNKYFQGTKITIYPSVPGLMRVNFRAPSSGQTCTVKINGVTAGAHGNSFGWSDYVEVPANTTDGIAIEMTNSANGYTRVNKIEFLALEDRRAAEWVKPGELGTVCLKNDAKVVGATVYELNGANEHGYMVFDEITEGEIEAGKPYLFEATRTGNVSFYKKLNAGHADDPATVDTKGMYGTFTGTTLTQGADNYYYFSGTHIWRVNDFTVSITIPAYCCYVDYDEFLNHPASTSPNPVRRRVVLGVNGTNTATGMENTEATDAPVKMMIDGQLFILRGEKLYDATGRLVK